VIPQDFYEEAYTVYRSDAALRSTDELIGHRNALVTLAGVPWAVYAGKSINGDAIVYRAIKDELASRFARESTHDLVGYDS
jgi:hypothetical protein